MHLIFIYLVFILSWIAKKLTIHLIPHSHNDAGWIQPFESYYKSSTGKTLTNVIDSLLADRSKTFHWSDIAFFHRWWQDQSEEHKQKVKTLVSEDRLIFIGGGWVMHDEALPSYKEVLLQMRVGLDFLKETFGVRPNIGWQIDPFGSSSATVSLLKKLGYDYLVENRVSNEFKSEMRRKDGYDFYWQGHWVDEDKNQDMIWTHILQYFYIFPQVRFDDQFLMRSMGSYAYTFFKDEIEPVIESIDALSNKTANEYHVMVPAGDDFAFVKAAEVFKKLDEMIAETTRLGNSKGFETIVKYGNLYSFFEDFKKLNLSLGIFEGDFLPYEEPWGSWEDFWTGYYSSRLHLKKFIRYVFNQIQGTKTHLAIQAMMSNNGSVDFNDHTESEIDKINLLIREAEQRWAILMHHDGITGTHTKVTEESYYDMLNRALDFLKLAGNLIEHDFYREVSQTASKGFRDFVKSLQNVRIYRHTIVNPSLYDRTQILNITVHDLKEESSYALFYQTSKDEVIKNSNDTIVVDLNELNLQTSDLQKIRKLFFTLEIPSLSNAFIYVIESAGSSMNWRFFHWAKNVTRIPLEQNDNLIEYCIKLNFDSNYNLVKLNSSCESVEIEIEESITYYETRFSTRSGLYLYNPRGRQFTMNLNNSHAWKYTNNDFINIVQVYSESNASSTKMLKTYVVDAKYFQISQNNLNVEVQFFTKDTIEVSYNIKRKPLSSSSQFKAYVHDSMRLVERPIYDPNSKIRATNKEELKGYYTYPWVNGGVITESYTNKNGFNTNHFTWVTSNSIGCTIEESGGISFLIFRNIGNNDNKGIYEYYKERFVTTTSFIFRMYALELIK